MSSRTDQGLPAKVTDPALLEEGARILSAAAMPNVEVAAPKSTTTDRPRKQAS